MVDSILLVNHSKSLRINDGLAICDGTKVKPFDGSGCCSVEKEMVGLSTTTLLVILLILRSGTLEWFTVPTHCWLRFGVVGVVVVPTVNCSKLLSWIHECLTNDVWNPACLWCGTLFRAYVEISALVRSCMTIGVLIRPSVEVGISTEREDFVWRRNFSGMENVPVNDGIWCLEDLNAVLASIVGKACRRFLMHNCSVVRMRQFYDPGTQLSQPWSHNCHDGHGCWIPATSAVLLQGFGDAPRRYYHIPGCHPDSR